MFQSMYVYQVFESVLLLAVSYLVYHYIVGNIKGENFHVLVGSKLFCGENIYGMLSETIG